MESIYQNYVSEFDLNFFEQSINGNPATPLAACPAARKLSIARIKERLKSVSQVVHKAKNTNEILLEVQKELLDTKQELEETRSLLFEKNEEHKVICDERSKYFNQATEYSNEIQNLKEQLKKFGEMDYDTKLKDKIINGYSDQMKGLQTEMENLVDDTKQKEKNATFALKQTKANKVLVEKKLVKLLKEYVVPKIKTRDKWLQLIIKKYLPEAHIEEEEEESNKVDKISENSEKQESCLEDEEPSTLPTPHRNASSDFDYVGSVDTGRGSSLEFSDGEKSFHSPDYYMECSPASTVGNICNKCNRPKSDVSTSPISAERSSADNFTMNVCVNISKKDACTSPIPIQRHDVAVNTVDVAIEIGSARNVKINLEENNLDINQTHLNIGNISQLTRAPATKNSASDYNDISSKHKVDSKEEPFASLSKLRDFTFDSDDSNGSGFNNLDDEELNTSPVNLDKVVSDSQIISSHDASIFKSQIYIEKDSRNQNCAEESPISPRGLEPESTIQFENESQSTPIKLQVNTEPDTHGDEIMHSESHVFSPVDFGVSNEPTILGTTKLGQNTSHSKIDVNRSSQQELQCLESNNSNNCSNDVEIDTEIQNIFDKMRLNYKIITPIPGTPPRRKLSVDNQNTIISKQTQVLAGTIDEHINLLRSKIQEVLTPFIETIPQHLEQIPRLFSNSDLNEQFLRNLLRDPNRTNEKRHENIHNIPSYNTHAESNNKRQPDVVSLSTDSMLCIAETNENEDSTYRNYTIFEEDSETENQFASSNVQQSEKFRPNSEISHVKNSKMSNAHVLKTEKSDFVAPLIVDDVAITKTLVIHQNTQDLLCDDVECDISPHENSNQPTTPSAIDSRNRIVYESRDISDDDSDMELSELDNSKENPNENVDKVLHKRRGKARKTTKLETLRLKMLPKCKIKACHTDTVRKLRPKPIPINTIAKKKVTASDTAASLNEKSVYENAVRVLSALKSKKQPRIIIEDCLNDIPKLNKNSSNENKVDNSSMSQPSTEIHISKNNKRKLSGNLTYVPENHTLDINKTTDDSKSSKRTGAPIEKKTSDKSPKNAKIFNTKRTHEVVHTSESSETKEPKRKRISVSNLQTSQRNSRSKDNIMATDSPRVLRSANLKHNKDIESKVTTVTPSRQGLRSKVDKNKSEIHDNISIISSGRKPRIARQSTRLDSESTQVEPHCSTVSEISSNTSIVPSGRKARIARQSTRLDSESTQVEPHCSTVSEISNNTSIVPSGRKPRIARQSTCLDSDSTQVEPYCSTVSETSNNTSIISSGRKPRIAKQSTRLDSESTQVEPYCSTVSETSNNTSIIPSGRKPRIARQSTRLDSESTQVEPYCSSVSEISNNTSIIPSGRKPRIARQSTCLDSESMQVEPYCSTVSEISKKNTRVSHEKLHFNEPVRDQIVDLNKLELDDKPLSLLLGTKSKSPRQKTNRDSEVELQNSDVSEISRNSNIGVDLSLLSDADTQDHENQSNLEIDDGTSMLSPGRKSRITRQSTGRLSESRQSNIRSENSTLSQISTKKNDNAVSYADLNLFSEEYNEDQIKTTNIYHKDSLLCHMIEKYGVQKIKLIAKQAPESKVNEIYKKLELSLTEIVEVPHNECLPAMKRLVAEIRTWNVKHFILGFLKFLKDPERKIELFNKSNCPPYPPMTKKEQVLLYVVDEIQKSYDYRSIVLKILINIEYTLLALNKTAEPFEVIESMSHFYALLCRSYQKISRLRLFIIDAMYCLQLKAVILVQQCLEVWMFALPLGHMGLAKCPLVTCLVYLLHFYKCDDKHNRVQDLRSVLRWKYNYDMADWNENKILDLFRTTIIEIKDTPIEKKTLRLSLLILAKRHGAKWCHNNIVKNMLQPLISDSSTSEVAKRFCVSLVGPLLRPYPSNMKVHREMIIDYLMDMLQRKNSLKMQEAIITSLMYIDKNNNRFYQFLAKWKPKEVSYEFELAFKDYVRMRPVHSWKQILSWQIY